MTAYHWLLFLHLCGAFSLVSGVAVAGTLQFAAMRRERPGEIAMLLGLSQVGVALIGVGSLMTLGFGLAPSWIQAALGLWAASLALGGIGGRGARHTRELAQRLAAEGDLLSPELLARVHDRRALWLSNTSGLLVLAIIVLMVWRPG